MRSPAIGSQKYRWTDMEPSPPLEGVADTQRCANLHVIGIRSAARGPFTMAVAAGSCVVVTGASGAGKSLRLRMIADLDPNEGDVRLGDQARADGRGRAWRRQGMYGAGGSGWGADGVGERRGGGAGARR